MKRKITPLFSFRIFLFFLMLMMLPSTGMSAQTISPQKLPFSAICAGGQHPIIPNQIFNEFQAKFIISGFDSDVTFVVELSDPMGSFTNPVATIALAPLPGTDPDTATNKTLTFAIPTNLVGSDTYRLRVKSSTGVVSGSFTIFGSISEKNFPAYFRPYNKSFFIANKASTVNFCSGASVTLTVDNPTPNDINSSPANFPELKYKWYKDDVLIPGQSSSSLMVNTFGVFYAELNYGPCSDLNYRSQEVTVSSATGGSGAIITSSLGNPFCSGSDPTILTATGGGNSYVWKLNGDAIPNANSQTYAANVSGIYTCDIDFGGCSATATIDLKMSGTVTYDGNDVKEGDILLIEEGDITVTASTNAVNPSYQWFLNNVPIDDATQNTLTITAAGKYKVLISGCTLSFIVSDGKEINVPKISNIISPNNDQTNDTWILPMEYNNTNTHVIVLSSYGEIVFETDNYVNYDNNYDCINSWPDCKSNIEFKNFNPVFYYIITPSSGSAKKGSITVLK